MATTLKIKVTKDILEKSKLCGGHMGSCAVALAIRDIFPNAVVGFSEMALFSPDILKIGEDAWGEFWNKFKTSRPKDNWVKVPDDMYRFILTFDRTNEADRPNLPEQEFEIQLSDEIINRVNIDEIKPLLENHPCLQLIEK